MPLKAEEEEMKNTYHRRVPLKAEEEEMKNRSKSNAEVEGGRERTGGAVGGGYSLTGCDVVVGLPRTSLSGASRRR